MNLGTAKRSAELVTATGALFALHHRLSTGKWYDKDQNVCHGKVGLTASVGGATARAGIELYERSKE